MIDRIGNDRVSPIGIGTWRMGGGSFPDTRNDEGDVNALRFAIDNGLTLIDTAEMYASGHAEELVGRAIRGYDRKDIFIVTKVWNNHLHYDDVIRSAKASLKRLNSKYIDLFLIHWPSSSVPIKETISAMEKLVDDGVTRYIGVSNFDIGEMEDAISSASRHSIVANEIEYSIASRSAERDVIPFCENNGLAVIAYTPINKGKLRGFRELNRIAEKMGKTPVQIALSYVMRRSIPIPMSTNTEHIREIAGAAEVNLSDGDYQLLKNS
jgi:diketogulonate reductase-like aldo/keto reductase